MHQRAGRTMALIINGCGATCKSILLVVVSTSIMLLLRLYVKRVFGVEGVGGERTSTCFWMLLDARWDEMGPYNRSP